MRRSLKRLESSSNYEEVVMSRESIDFVIAKLENIHEDLTLLKKQVDDLRQMDSGRKAVGKFLVAALTILGATVGWLVDNAVTVAKHIEYKE